MAPMSAPRINAAFYAAPVEAFLAASDEEAYAPLAAPHERNAKRRTAIVVDRVRPVL